MNWNNIKITIFKELRGVVRDKKTFIKLVRYPLIIPLFILLLGFLFDVIEDSDYVVGVNYQLSVEEKSIISNLGNLTFKEYIDESELMNAYENKEISGYIIKNDNRYTIYVDESSASGEVILSIANLYLESYSKVLGSNYLMENDLDPSMVYNNIIIESSSLIKDDVGFLGKMVFSFVITYITMIIVMVCVVVASDTTSGEKERGTLETILTFPIKSSELITGKYLATTILGFILGVISYLLAIPAFYYSTRFFKSYEDIVFTSSAESIILVIIVILLSSFLISGICMALSGKAKTFKEAQSSLQAISFLPMLPYFLTILEIDGFIYNLIPIANCSLLLNNIVLNDISYQALFIIIISTIIYTTIILIYISKQYKKEETLFS